MVEESHIKRLLWEQFLPQNQTSGTLTPLARAL